jgi:DNA-directed RNA polymerase specialized sigma24 family protein
MDEQGWLTERFEENRPRLRGVAYRMLGSLTARGRADSTPTPQKRQNR